MTVGEQRFAITLTDSAAAQALSGLLPLTLEMSDLNRNEKYATLPRTLPARASRPATIRNGDVMLYGTDTLVVFYKDFDSAYAYTRLGHISDPSSLARALGPGSVQATFTHD
ncbi:MAG: cyclophilin-like fold protein [Pseudomonas sp.]